MKFFVNFAFDIAKGNGVIRSILIWTDLDKAERVY